VTKYNTIHVILGAVIQRQQWDKHGEYNDIGMTQWLALDQSRCVLQHGEYNDIGMTQWLALDQSRCVLQLGSVIISIRTSCVFIVNAVFWYASFCLLFCVILVVLLLYFIPLFTKPAVDDVPPTSHRSWNYLRRGRHGAGGPIIIKSITTGKSVSGNMCAHLARKPKGNFVIRFKLLMDIPTGKSWI